MMAEAGPTQLVEAAVRALRAAGLCDACVRRLARPPADSKPARADGRWRRFFSCGGEPVDAEPSNSVPLDGAGSVHAQGVVQGAEQGAAVAARPCCSLCGGAFRWPFVAAAAARLVALCAPYRLGDADGLTRYCVYLGGFPELIRREEAARELAEVCALYSATGHPHTFVKTAFRDALTEAVSGLMSRLVAVPGSGAQVVDVLAVTLNLALDKGGVAQLEELVAESAPVVLTGRYRKLGRRTPQSQWLLGGERLLDESVHEIIERHVRAPFALPASGRVVFSSAGREDVDVRCLGSGRPFNVTIHDAHVYPWGSGSPKEWAETLMAQINQATQQLETATRVSTEAKRKSYCAVVWVARAVSEAELQARLCARLPLRLHQRTPVRVLHRRALLERLRDVYSLTVKALTPHVFIMSLETQGGTYVKEFVHGDLGRTRPSVAELLECEATMLQLDVADVAMAIPGERGLSSSESDSS